MTIITAHIKKIYYCLSALSVFWFMIVAYADEVLPHPKAGFSEEEKTLVDKDNLIQTVRKLQSYGTRRSFHKQLETATWIHQKLLNEGIESFIDNYTYEEQTWPNVIAAIPGQKLRDQIVMAVAHFDSYADNHQGIAPGADDNATGVAALLEIGRILSKKSNQKTIILAFFSNEEVSAQGSKHFVQKADKNGLQIEAVINLDVLGYNNYPDFSFSEVLNAHQKFKHKLKAFYRIGLNRLNRVFTGDTCIKVAGKKSNARLASIVAENCAKIEGLNVKKMVNDDCG